MILVVVQSRGVPATIGTTAVESRMHDYSVYQMTEGNRVAVNRANAIVVGVSQGDFQRRGISIILANILRLLVFNKRTGARLLIRVLIADHYEDWRRQVHSLLQARPDWQVVAEASDGQEAVQKANDLKPDLILPDIGLPKLNGIEVARQIRQCSPSSKIIFLSMNNDPEIVRAALTSGALGYVRKMDARRDLLRAVDAVLGGRQFVSDSLKGYEFTDTSS
jgi:CheY-like chemotaxis protein